MVFISSKNVTSLLCALWLLLSYQRSESVVGQPVAVEDWNQIGRDINGDDAGDQSGSSVAMSSDGTTIAVGAVFTDNGDGIGAGHVRVYKLNQASEQYKQYTPDINGRVFLDNFGSSLTMSADGNTMAVGARFHDGTGFDSGSVRMFRVNTASPSSIAQYQQIGSDILGEAANDYFGHSLAMSADGSVFVVGTPANDGNGESSGHARVFKIDALSPKGFTQIGPDLDGTVTNDQFGWSVAISADGTTIAVGGIGGVTNAGYVRVYKLDANTNRYNQIGADIVGEADGDQLGYSLAMSADGSTFAAGARFNDGNGSNSGHVRVYKIDSLGQEYIQIGFDIDGEVARDWFGCSMAMSSDGSTMAIGALFNDGNGFIAGHVRVFQLDPATAGQYRQIGRDIDGEGEGDEFGTSIDMSSDGTMIVVGARYNGGNGFLSGHVRVFRYSPIPNPCGFFCSIWKFICRIVGFCSN